MTKMLYMEDSYLKESSAVVVNIIENSIVLDQSIFSPRGGGLPSDTGIIMKMDDKSFVVTEVVKKDGEVFHILNGTSDLSTGDLVTGKIDWDRRYRIMRMHTACHILAAVLNREHGALITGNQIDLDQSRMDFNVETFDRDAMNACVEKANSAISRDIAVRIYTLERKKAMEIPGIVKLAKGLPPGLDTLRIVEIGDADTQADGGVHVSRTGEIGRINLLKLENKGKNNRRIYLSLNI